MIKAKNVKNSLKKKKKKKKKKIEGPKPTVLSDILPHSLDGSKERYPSGEIRCFPFGCQVQILLMLSLVHYLTVPVRVGRREGEGNIARLIKDKQ